MSRTIESIPTHAEEVAQGYYAVTEDGEIYRVIGNRGTWRGRKLTPYAQGRYRYVTFHYEGRRVPVDVDLLARIVFRRPA